MKLGVLQCDDVTDELQVIHGNYPQMFESLLTSLDDSLEVVIYKVIDGIYPEHVDECDAYITTGSRFGVNDDYQWIRVLEEYVRELYVANKKLVGICFGHQLIAKALGGEVVKTSKGWGIGVATNEIRLDRSWMHDAEPTMSLIVSHQDQVVRLPKGATIIAGNDFCPNYMMQVNNHFLGIQGHPEFSKAYSHDLMLARKHRIPMPRIEQGIESLERSVDDKKVTRWLIQFLASD